MKFSRIKEILNRYFDNEIIFDTAEINSFIMDRDYFLDVFETRYEISIDLNRPIEGLKETLDAFNKSSAKEIQSTSIKDANINAILYTDPSFEKVYGIVNFLD